MVRTGNLNGRRLLLVLILVATGGSPSAAEAPLDWYVDLKRLAKEGRLAAHQGAYGADLKLLAVRAKGLADRVADWAPLPASPTAQTVCLGATRRLELALNERSAPAVASAVRTSESDLDTCRVELQKR